MGYLLVRDIVKMAQSQLQDAGIADPKTESEILYCYYKHIDRSRFFMQWADEADENTCENYFDLVARRCSRVPLQHITGTQEFMGLEFDVRPGVLIPRLDSEVTALAAELIIKEKKYKTCLDLCCGSGALGIALAKRTGVKVTSADISAEAVALTKQNAAKLGAKIETVKGDLFEAVKKKKYQIIVSNPPYIKTDVIPTLMPEVKDHDPLTALDGGADGLDFYRRIIAEAPAHMKKDASLVLEIGDDQAYDITEILENDPNYREIKVIKDLAKLDRVITCEYTGK